MRVRLQREQAASAWTGGPAEPWAGGGESLGPESADSWELLLAWPVYSKRKDFSYFLVLGCLRKGQ